MAFGYSGDTVIAAVQGAVLYALTRGYPLVYDRVEASLLARTGGDLGADMANARAISTPWDLFAVLDSELLELERRLDEAEAALAVRGRDAPR